MKKFMLAIENFMRTVGVGYRAIINRNQDKIKSMVIFDHNIEKNSQKRTTNYNRKGQNEFYEKNGYGRR